MTTLARARVVWGGSAIDGAGVSTFYSVGAGSGLAAALEDFFASISDGFPPSVNWQIPASGDLIDDNTGSITGGWSGGPGTTVVGDSTSNLYVRGVGLRLVWQTDGITSGRRVKGTTYMVPVVKEVYDTDGTISTTAIEAYTTNAQAFLTAMAGDLVILTRLTPAHSGTSHEVTGVQVPDKVAWLRTRKT